MTKEGAPTEAEIEAALEANQEQIEAIKPSGDPKDSPVVPSLPQTLIDAATEGAAALGLGKKPPVD